MEEKPFGIAAGLDPSTVPKRLRLEFGYDAQHRRIGKVVKAWQGDAGSGGFELVKDRRFVYAGWNMIAELDHLTATGTGLAAATVVRTQVWGLDLSGTPQGAGGVGGLLAVRHNGQSYVPLLDGNGTQGDWREPRETAAGWPKAETSVGRERVNCSVMGFIDMESGLLAARFDYDALGTLITDWSAPGHSAWEISRIRFSGKYQDPHTGWLYYGYRYLDTVNGRWPSRDPIGVRGGINLYGMVGNDPVNNVDILGLAYPGAEQVQPATPDWLPKVSDIARGKGWSHLGRLFDHWFSRPLYNITNPVNVGLSDPYEDTIITFDWLLSFSRARSEIEKFHNPNTYRNSNERERLRNRLRALGPNTHRFGEEWMNESDPRKLHQHWISQKTVGGSSLFMDALDAALHRFTVQSVVAGCLHKEGDGYTAYITEYAIYAKDSFDFNGNQHLGYWKEPNQVSYFSGGRGSRLVTNDSFRKFQAATGKGGDFFVFSKPKKFKVKGGPWKIRL